MDYKLFDFLLTHIHIPCMYVCIAASTARAINHSSICTITFYQALLILILLVQQLTQCHTLYTMNTLSTRSTIHNIRTYSTKAMKQAMQLSTQSDTAQESYKV